MQYIKIYSLLSIIPLLFLNNGAVQAQSPMDKGREIIKMLIDQDNGFGDFRSDVTMIIYEDNGKQYDRQMEVRSLEEGDKGEKRLFVFSQPKDISGTALLSYTLDGKDSQWIYLPAFKRIKRIATSNKSSAFVSSEFSYEDLSSVELEKYDYQYLSDESVEGISCYVVKMMPLFEDSGYHYQVAYVDKNDYIFRKLEYFDQKEQKIKTLRLDDYKKYLDHYWRPHVLKMVNHQNGRATDMLWTNVAYRNDFAANDFSVGALKRSR